MYAESGLRAGFFAFAPESCSGVSFVAPCDCDVKNPADPGPRVALAPAVRDGQSSAQRPTSIEEPSDLSGSGARVPTAPANRRAVEFFTLQSHGGIRGTMTRT